MCETALEAELSEYLGDTHEPIGRNWDNSRNGTVPRPYSLRSALCRSRCRGTGSFEPVILRAGFDRFGRFPTGDGQGGAGTRPADSSWLSTWATRRAIRPGRGSPNSRNGATPILATEIGDLPFDAPRDGAGSLSRGWSRKAPDALARSYVILIE